MNSTGQTILTLRTDNGGEYISKAFQEFCSSKGIARELTPPHTPQRNGVAERRNRSILDITRCLLLDKALPGHLWGEAVKAASDILNLRSTKRHPDKTPNGLFFGKKPSITHLRIFDSSAFAHIPKPSRTKLDPRSERCILLSFDEAARAYRCYRPSTRKFFVSKDIVIGEDSFSTPTQTPEPKPTPTPDNIPAPTRTEDSQALLGVQPQYLLPDPLVNPPSPSHVPIPLPDFQQVTSPTATVSDSTPPIPEQAASPTSSPISINNPPWRSDRIRRFPRHLYDFAAHVELDPSDSALDMQSEHLTFQQVHTHPHWKAAMQEEIDSIHSNNTWTLVDLPPNKKAISSRWVYKVKTSRNGSLPRYKARLVARGFEQKDGIDFLDTFAPLVRWETIRILVAIAIHLNWPIHQLDVLIAFLNGILKEDVYMHQPLGFIQRGDEHLVCKLHKSFYWPSTKPPGLVCPTS